MKIDATNVLCIGETVNRCDGGKQEESAEFTHVRMHATLQLHG